MCVWLRDILSSISRSVKIFVAFGRNHNKLLSAPITPQLIYNSSVNRKPHSKIYFHIILGDQNGIHWYGKMLPTLDELLRSVRPLDTIYIGVNNEEQSWIHEQWRREKYNFSNWQILNEAPQWELWLVVWKRLVRLPFLIAKRLGMLSLQYIHVFTACGQTCQVFSMTCPMGQLK